jgi:TPR repeat protein
MGARRIRLTLAIVLTTAGTAHADDYSNLVGSFEYSTATCDQALADARVAIAFHDDSTDADVIADLKELRDEVDSLKPYCTGLQSYVDGLPQVVADWKVCAADCVSDPGSSACQDVQTRNTCDQVDALLKDSSDKLMGWIQVTATSEAIITMEIDKLTLRDHSTQCDGGDGIACGELGDAYEIGSFAKRSPKNAKKYWKLAIKLLDKQCKEGHDRFACSEIAGAYEDGGFGVGASKAKAKKYRALEDKYSESPSDSKLDDMFGK